MEADIQRLYYMGLRSLSYSSSTIDWATEVVNPARKRSWGRVSFMRSMKQLMRVANPCVAVRDAAGGTRTPTRRGSSQPDSPRQSSSGRRHLQGTLGDLTGEQPAVPEQTLSHRRGGRAEALAVDGVIRCQGTPIRHATLSTCRCGANAPPARPARISWCPNGNPSSSAARPCPRDSQFLSRG